MTVSLWRLSQVRAHQEGAASGTGGGGVVAVPVPAGTTTPAKGGAKFTAVPPGRALLEDGGAVAVGSVGGWNVVMIDDVMTDGTWEWEVEFVGGSNTCQLAVFEGPPSARSLPNASDANVLCTAIACTLRYIRGASDSGAPNLGVRAGQRLRMRYVSAAGTVDVSVDGRPTVRVLDGVRRGDVRPGFFLSATSKMRLVSFAHTDGAAGGALVRGVLRLCLSSRKCACDPMTSFYARRRVPTASWSVLVAAAAGAVQCLCLPLSAQHQRGICGAQQGSLPCHQGGPCWRTATPLLLALSAAGMSLRLATPCAMVYMSGRFSL
jgi:hypothetical protein